MMNDDRYDWRRRRADAPPRMGARAAPSQAGFFITPNGGPGGPLAGQGCRQPRTPNISCTPSKPLRSPRSFPIYRKLSHLTKPNQINDYFPQIPHFMSKRRIVA